MDWAATSGIVLALAGLSVAMVSVPRHPEFWVARLCFAAAALVFAGKGFFWAMSFGQPISLRVAVSGAVGAITLIALVEGWLWVSRHEKAATEEQGVAGTSVAARAFIECDIGVMPTLVPQEGRIHVL